MSDAELIEKIKEQIAPIKQQFPRDVQLFEKAENYIIQYMLKHKEFLTKERRCQLANRLHELQNNGRTNYLYRKYDDYIENICELPERQKARLDTYKEIRKLTVTSTITQSEIANILKISEQMVSKHHKKSDSPMQSNSSAPPPRKRALKPQELINWIYYILGYALIYGVSPLYLLGLVNSQDIYVPYNLYNVKRLSNKEEKIRLISDKKLKKQLLRVKNYKHRKKGYKFKQRPIYCQRLSDFIKYKKTKIPYNSAISGHRNARIPIFEEIPEKNYLLVQNLLLHIFSPTPSSSSNKNIQEELKVNQDFLLMILELTFVDQSFLTRLKTLIDYRIQYLCIAEEKSSILSKLKSKDELAQISYETEYYRRKDEFLKEYLFVCPFHLLDDFCKFEFSCLSDLLVILLTSTVSEKKSFSDTIYFYGIIDKEKTRLNKLLKLTKPFWLT